MYTVTNCNDTTHVLCLSLVLRIQVVRSKTKLMCICHGIEQPYLLQGAGPPSLSFYTACGPEFSRT